MALRRIAKQALHSTGIGPVILLDLQIGCEPVSCQPAAHDMEEPEDLPQELKGFDGCCTRRRCQDLIGY